MKQFILRFWSILLVIAVWFIFSSPYFLKGLTPFPSKYLVTFFPPWSAAYGMPVKNNAMPDVITQIYPWKRVTIESWKMGQMPLWNPYSFSGTAHLANYQSAVLSPVNLLFFIIPQIDAWSFMILLQPLLAGLFMYFLLRTLERSKPASTIGAIAFMFCGFLTVWMAYGTLGWAVLWLPLALTAVIRQFSKRSWWNIVLLSLALALSFVSGHFQMSTYVLIAVVAFILYETIRRKAYKAGIKLTAAIFIGLLLSAPQLLPSLEAYQNSVRSELFNQSGGIAWRYLITLFAPDFFGNPVTRNDWFGYYAEWASFIGVVPLLLGLYAITRKKTPISWFFWGLAFISLLTATPSPLNALFIQLKIPAISTSYAARIIVLTSFALAVLSAYGFDELFEDWQKKRVKQIVLPVLVVAVFLLVIWGLLFMVQPFPPDKLLIAKRNLILPTALALSACGLFILGLVKRWKIRNLAILAILGLTAFDLLRYVTKWMPFDPQELVYPPMKVVSFLEKEIGANRVLGNFGNEMATYFAIPSIEGYDALYQKRYGEFLSSASHGKIGVPERSVVQFPKYGIHSEQVLQLLGVKYNLYRLSDRKNVWAYPFWNYPHYTSIYRDEHYEVFLNQRALPRAFLASSYVVAKSDQEILDRLYQPDFDQQETIILEQKPSLEPAWGKGRVDIQKYTPNEVTFLVETTVPKLLFLSDVYDGGWKATVDGAETPVYRANYDFRAVSVPSGSHILRLYYWPKTMVTGLALAAVVGLILVVGSLKTLL